MEYRGKTYANRVDRLQEDIYLENELIK